MLNVDDDNVVPEDYITQFEDTDSVNSVDIIVLDEDARYEIYHTLSYHSEANRKHIELNEEISHMHVWSELCESASHQKAITMNENLSYLQGFYSAASLLQRD